MKKIFLLAFASLIVLSCSLDDNATNLHYEILPVESYDVPTSFQFGKVYDIAIFYKRPNDCHTRASLYFEKKDSIRTIAVQSLVLDKNNCTPLPNEEPRKGTFRFEVVRSTPYLFKFYKGQDANGTDVFEEVTIPVIN